MNTDKQKKGLIADDELGLVVHSYNNHLAAMMGYIELLLLQQESSSSKEYLHHSLDSGNEAVHFGKSILASIGRLQISMEQHSLNELLRPLLENPHLDVFSEDINDTFQIKTNPEWFNECLTDLIDFILKINVKQQISVKIIKDNGEFCKIIIESKFDIEKQFDQESLFMPFYSSRHLLGTKDIGLAKAKGFFKQMDSNLSWKNNRGFCLEIPILN